MGNIYVCIKSEASLMAHTEPNAVHHVLFGLQTLCSPIWAIILKGVS
jgi:hypothetical protein